ncbi:SWI/SNF complex 60 kDa subunit [Vararia minispora EC-137]|uniref:SWI/SNF complex 60 kDa subunit n=1 Tax=Vararia minispora EC-137 TaxID=1314806 RepID=A0ACB8QGS3_9AGAM|nr:SWI/SNF complex 60 kDa subunit [Vararia minispora EC-137]
MPEGQKPPKKRKLVDKNVPSAIVSDPAFAVDSKMYQDLLDMEKKLDWTTMRKKAEVQDALARVPSMTRTLRLFVSHSVSEQRWQQGDAPVEPSPETGKGIPAWQLKIEGRLLELPNPRWREKTPRPLSTFVKSMIVEFDRDPALYPDGNIVEWERGSNQPTLDGFTIRRKGDAPTKTRIILHLEQYPEHYKVHPELGIKEDSRVGVIQALWNYVKVQSLQDKVDRRRVRIDGPLRPIVANVMNGQAPETLPFVSLPELVNRYLSPPDPIIIHYNFDPNESPPEKPSAWDIEVRVEDVALKAKMSGLTISAAGGTTKEITKLDDEIATLVQSLHSSVLKRTFLNSFASDPSGFIQSFLESQSRDLETILGSGPTDGATLRREDLQRSEFFRMPWVEEAVAVWDGLRLANRA